MYFQIDNRQEEVCVLSTCRKFVKDIASGKKTIETRPFNDMYAGMFLDPSVIEANERGEEWRTPVKDVRYLKLHDRHGCEVVAECDEAGLADLTPKGMERLRKEYGFTEFDDAAAMYAGKSWSESVPVFFYFHISRIISSRGV